MEKRVFIAINLPENLKQELEILKEEIEGLFPDFPEGNKGIFNWTKQDNLHITLIFIGSISEQKIPEISRIVKESVSGEKPFSIKIKKISYGPPKSIPPRLIWLENEKNKELTEIVEKLKKAISEKNIRGIEEKSFSPHITMARIKEWQWRKIEPEERPEIEREINLKFEVKSIEIMESRLKRTGAEYIILETCNLKSETS